MRHVAVDCIIRKGDSIILIRRRHDPSMGMLALPGGMVEDETVEHALRREMMEETGVELFNIRLVGIYSNPSRDPRKSISIAFTAEAKGEPRAGDDAAELMLVKPEEALEMDLAFDHKQILRDWLSGGECVFR